MKQVLQRNNNTYLTYIIIITYVIVYIYIYTHMFVYILDLKYKATTLPNSGEIEN